MTTQSFGYEKAPPDLPARSTGEEYLTEERAGEATLDLTLLLVALVQMCQLASLVEDEVKEFLAKSQLFNFNLKN